MDIISGPCEAQATFACTGAATSTILDPRSMEPGSRVPARDLPSCRPCADTLADQFLARSVTR